MAPTPDSQPSVQSVVSMMGVLVVGHVNACVEKTLVAQMQVSTANWKCHELVMRILI